jgi:glycosyltransferase involved in cell wall biosynthesis
VVPGLIAAGGLFLAIGALAGLLILEGSRRLPILEDALAGGAPGRLPALSVIVTARDEEAAIETTVRSLLAQRYPGLEVIVVDDRSTDGTAAILDRIAADPDLEAGRLVVLHNRSLPRGWVGKCHACHLGAARARGDWLLFTDGDVTLVGDRLLAGAVALAERLRLDHVAVLPDLRPMPPLQSALVAVFGQMFMAGARAWEMDRDRPRGGAGIGAFNLVRRASYDRIGGHQLLRMDLADDFKLGRLLKESGARQRFYIGLNLVRCPWHVGAWNVVRGLEKNFFAAFDFSALQAGVATLGLLSLGFGPLACALAVTLLARPVPPPLLLALAWAPFALETAFVALSYLLEARRHGFNPWLLAALHPVGLLLLVLAIWNSALKTLLRGGVRWRDTFYPLAALRAGQVPPGAGRRLAAPGVIPSGEPPRP